MLDLPAVPIFLAAICLQHLTLGLVATGGVLLVVAMAIASHSLSRPHHTSAASTWARLLQLCETLGSRDEQARDLDKRWCDLAEVRTRLQQRAAAWSAIGTAAIKGVRAILQTSMVAVGAWLVLRDEISPGAMVVASIFMGRAVAPVEAAVAQWRNFASALASWRRLVVLLDAQALPAAQSCSQNRRYELARERVTIGTSSIASVPSVRLRSEARVDYTRPMLE
jgi:ABC-type protease/lipase transport system fused ATPase/permease subunit